MDEKKIIKILEKYNFDFSLTGTPILITTLEECTTEIFTQGVEATCKKISQKINKPQNTVKTLIRYTLNVSDLGYLSPKKALVKLAYEVKNA